MDSLSPLDAAFLRLESQHTSLHIASVAVFDGPPPSGREMATHFENILPLLPRYRQRMREVPFRVAQPMWVDDPTFDLDRHLFHTALPAPGGSEQLQDLMGRLMSQQLEHDRPLWQCWLVDGLAEGRWALINKIHHCLVDGIAGTDLLGVLLDRSPHSAATTQVPPWHPRPAPGPIRLLAAAASAMPKRSAGTVQRFVSVARRPRSSAGTAVGVLRGAVKLSGTVRIHRATSLTGSVGADRCWTGVSVSRADVSDIRRVLGGTVNDVVVAAVTQGFRSLLLQRDESLPGEGVVTLVPVSVRGPDSHASDNQISAMLATLPVVIAEPARRYAVVRAQLEGLKGSGESVAVRAFTTGARYVPPVLSWTGLTLGFRLRQRVIATVVTNVPGPRETLYALGRRLVELYPYVPIADQVRTAVAITSYADRLYFGVTADRDSTPDISVLAAGIVAGINDLREAAAQPAASPGTQPRPQPGSHRPVPTSTD